MRNNIALIPAYMLVLGSFPRGALLAAALAQILTAATIAGLPFVFPPLAPNWSIVSAAIYVAILGCAGHYLRIPGALALIILDRLPGRQEVHDLGMKCVLDGVRIAKARVIADGRPADHPLCAEVIFDFPTILGHPTIHVRALASSPDAIVPGHLAYRRPPVQIGELMRGEILRELQSRLSPWQRLRFKISAFCGAIIVPDQPISNHDLLAARVRADAI